MSELLQTSFVEVGVMREGERTLRSTSVAMKPGTPYAIAHGCTCPRLDGHGTGHLGGVPGEDGEPMFWIEKGCPIHDFVEASEEFDQAHQIDPFDTLFDTSG